MKFNDVKRSVMLTLAAHKTPIVVGERGIGKTQMMKEIAATMDMKLINIDCNLLKEGEIGGLPLPYKLDNGTTVTTYAVHAKLKAIEDYLAERPDGKVLLFFDELNRTTRETMAELMNLILNKEINDYKVPDNVCMVAAMNPSSSTSGFEGNTSYGVTDMDAASKNRLVWLYLETDARTWLDWAIEKPDTVNDIDQISKLQFFDRSKYKTIIDERIIEFISSFPDLLNSPREDQDVSPSSRTWEFASDIIRTYEMNKDIFTTTQYEACLKGCIGIDAQIQFMNFLMNNENPLIKPEEFFAGKVIKKELLDKFECDTLPRQILMAKNVGRYLAEKEKVNKTDIAKITTIFDLLPIDSRLVVMRYIANSFAPLHKKLTNNEDYLELYMNAVKMLKK